MAAQTHDIKQLEQRMRGVLDTLKREFSGLRTGRASAALLDPITVEVYGQKMPLNQVANVSVPEPRMIAVQVWDKGTVSAVDRAIRDSNLGLNPVVDGTLLRLPIPPLTSDRRQELVKIAHKYAESARVAVRNVRRDGNDTLKKLEKDSEISKDDHKKFSSDIQELTDRIIKEIEEMLGQKDKEINTV
ncbi:MAG: ribosome recycling factor [Hyphomicrobiaceae bacterium]|nr:ribosome recycling factor [Hyphomicrobiaceae bacterium]